MRVFFFNRKLFATAFISVFAAASLSAASCHEGGMDTEARANEIVTKITDKLNLNETQRGKLEVLKDTILEAKSRHKAEKEAVAKEVKTMILSDKLDAVRAKEIMERRQEIVRQEFGPIFEKLVAFHETLTLEQKKEIVNYIEKLHSTKPKVETPKDKTETPEQ